jgi:carboxyl-terminal processing protease
MIFRRLELVIFIGCLWLGTWCLAVDTAPAPGAEPVSRPEVKPENTAGFLQTSLAQTLELLEKNGLLFDEVAASRSVIQALAATADPFSRLLTEEDHRRLSESARGVAYDTGIHFVQSNRYAVVTRVADDSSAAEAGLEVGDFLVGIGGEQVADLDVANIQERLRGVAPGQVTLSVQRGDQKPEKYTLDQRRVELRAIEESVRLPAGLGYVRINGLFPGAGVAIADILAAWSVAGIDGVVLDLRGANGGDLDSVITVASLMSKPDHVLFSYRDAADHDLEVHHARTGASLGAPLMLLVDKQTSGAAELLAAVLSGTGHGTMLIGSPTAGDPLIREPVTLTDGHVLYIASRRLVVGEGKTYAGKETVRPDIMVSPQAVYPDFDLAAPVLTDPRGVTDAELETQALRVYINGDIPMTRAVDVLLGLKALNLHSFDYEGSVRH